MSRQNQPEFPSKVYAEAVVRSASGASLLRSLSLVTSGWHVRWVVSKSLKKRFGNPPPIVKEGEFKLI
jgi:hypothetical protein